MKKELLFAIIAGGILGLIIAFGIWRVNLSVKSTTPQGNLNQAQTEKTPTPGAFTISLANWENNDVATQSSIIITGQTQAKSLVTFSTDENDYLTQANDLGTFSEKISLLGGINQILISAFNPSGQKAEIALNIIYSSEFAKSLPTPSENPTDATKAAQEKALAVINKPQAYLGTVTDLTESTIQLKGEKGDILMVNTSDETTFVKVTTLTKEIKSEDVAIGDYLIALGFKDAQNVLTARRVILVSNPVPLGAKAFWGNVETINATSLSLNIPEQSETSTFSLKPVPDVYSFTDNKVTKIKLSSIEETNKVILSTIKSKDTYAPRTIFQVN
jgi:hypothetical protein